MASTQIPSLGSRSVKTCTECKQSKLRCDSKAKFPNPCTRCQTRQLLCTIDPSFQRTPAKKRLEAMTKELQELRNQRDGEFRSKSPLESTSTPEQPSSASLEDDFDPGLQAFDLRGTLVDAPSIVEAFKLFATLFRRQLPVLGAVSMQKSYRDQPLLFWTIVVVVSSRMPGQPYESIFACLKGPYTGMLREEILSAPLPLHNIQALLLLCMWPMPVDKQQRDPSWLYCGVATHAARFMGLDRQPSLPSFRFQGVVAGDAPARINTWLGCFYVGTTLSLYLGLPPPIDSELDFTTIHSFLGRKTVSDEFAAQVRMQLLVAKFTNLLMHSMNEAANASLIRILDSELEVLKPSVRGHEGSVQTTEYHILAVKIHFYALSLTRLQPRTPSYEITLRAALTVSLRLIHLANLQMGDGPAGNPDISALQHHRSLSKNYFRALAFTTILLLKFFSLNPSTSPEEQQSAANHIVMSQNLFKTCSMAPKDEWARVAKVFEVMARLAPDMSGSKSRVTHRMGASILTETMNAVYEMQGRTVELDSHERTLDDKRPDEEAEGADEAPVDGLSYPAEQMTYDLGFLGEFWDDPIRNLLSFDVGAPFFENI